MNVHEFNSIFEKNALRHIEPEGITEEDDTIQNNITESVNPNEKIDDLKETDSSLQNCATGETPNTDEDPSIRLNNAIATSLHKSSQSCESTSEKLNTNVNPCLNQSSQIVTVSPLNMTSLQDSNKETSYNDIDTEFSLSELDIVKSDNIVQSLKLSDKKYNQDAAPQQSLAEINQFETPTSDANSSTKAPSPDTPQKQTRGQNIRSWWKKRKSRLVRFFTACVCCAGPPPADKE